MALNGATFFDTSVLVAGLLELGSAESDAARRLLQAVADETVDAAETAWHCCLEFYSVTTRLPGEYRLAPEAAFRVLREGVLDRFRVSDLPSEERRPLLAAAAAARVHGGRLYDLHIAEVARTAGASVVVTGNRRHFFSLLRYGVRVLTASELVDELGLAS